MVEINEIPVRELADLLDTRGFNRAFHCDATISHDEATAAVSKWLTALPFGFYLFNLKVANEQHIGGTLILATVRYSNS